MSIQNLSVNNFLVPAQGTTNVAAITLPGDITLSGNPITYTIDWISLNQIVQGQLFIPQACTIDASNLTPGSFLTFSIPALGFNRIIPAGSAPTFQFPALQNLVTSITPSAGTPSFNTFWYNYPALPDDDVVTASLSGSVAISSLPPAPLSPFQWTLLNGAASAAGNTVIYVPSSRFILQSIQVKITPDATIAAASDQIIRLLDGATIVVGATIFVPAVAPVFTNATPEPIVLSLDFANNPYLSLAPGNTLSIQLTSGALATGAFRTIGAITG